jgi:hypothetical protein
MFLDINTVKSFKPPFCLEYLRIIACCVISSIITGGSLSTELNPSVWRHLIPGQYSAVGGFSTWVFKFEPESAKHFKYV